MQVSSDGGSDDEPETAVEQFMPVAAPVDDNNGGGNDETETPEQDGLSRERDRLDDSAVPPLSEDEVRQCSLRTAGVLDVLRVACEALRENELKCFEPMGGLLARMVAHHKLTVTIEDLDTVLKCISELKYTRQLQLACLLLGRLARCDIRGQTHHMDVLLSLLTRYPTDTIILRHVTVIIRDFLSVSTRAVDSALALANVLRLQRHAIERGGVETVIAVLRAHPTSRGVKTGCCAALCSLMSVAQTEGEGARRAFEAGAIPTVVTTLNAFLVDVYYEGSACALEFLVLATRLKDALADVVAELHAHNCLQAALTALRHWPTDSFIVRVVAELVRVFISSTFDVSHPSDVPQLCVETWAAVNDLLAANANDVGLQRWGCYIIAMFALRRLGPHVVAHGALDRLLAAMRLHGTNQAVVERGCTALRLLARNKSRREGLVAAKVPSLLLPIMVSYYSSAVIVACCCSVIASTIKHGSGDPPLSQLIEAVVTAMEAHPDDDRVQEAACHAIHNFGEDAQDLVKLLTIGKRGVEAVIAAMWKHSGRVQIQRYGCHALRTLTKSSGGERTSPIVTHARMQLALVVMAAASNHPTDAAVQELACMVLGNLADRGEGGVALLGCGASVTVLSAMRGHMDKARVQSAACHALQEFMDNKSVDNLASVVEAGAVEAIVSAMHLHPASERLQRAACRVLVVAYGSNTGPAKWPFEVRIADHLAREGGAEAVIVAMLSHAGEYHIQFYGSKTLLRLVQHRQAPSQSEVRSVVDPALLASLRSRHVLDALLGAMLCPCTAYYARKIGNLSRHALGILIDDRPPPL